MKVLKNVLYRDMISVIVNDKAKLLTNERLVLFRQSITAWPSKSIFCLALDRLISYIERNIKSIDLILETMDAEDEDKEIVDTIRLLRKAPTITTVNEVSMLCDNLTSYVRYSKLLKSQDSFIKAADIIENNDDMPIPDKLEYMRNICVNFLNDWNSVAAASSKHTFDSNEKEQMKAAIARTKDNRSADKIIVTGIKALNIILSPGYRSGSVYVYQGLPGCYKSGILLKGHVDCLKYNKHIFKSTHGKTPISMYISMENTLEQTISRLFSLLYPNADMDALSVDEITDMIDSALRENDMRSVILYYGYREKSTVEIADIVRSYNNEKYEVVILFLDYIKRIRPASKDSITKASEKGELNAIMNEMKSEIAVKLNIPVVTGHQLNREAAKQIDDIIRQGGYNKSDMGFGRSNTGSAWEIMEVADTVIGQNIETTIESKQIVMKALKQREVDGKNETMIIGFRHPFLSPQSFALKDDINEPMSLSVPIFAGRQSLNFVSAV